MKKVHVTIGGSPRLGAHWGRCSWQARTGLRRVFQSGGNCIGQIGMKCNCHLKCTGGATHRTSGTHLVVTPHEISTASVRAPTGNADGCCSAHCCSSSLGLVVGVVGSQLVASVAGGIGSIAMGGPMADAAAGEVEESLDHHGRRRPQHLDARRGRGIGRREHRRPGLCAPQVGYPGQCHQPEP